MMGGMDIAKFITARLDEDEQWALAASQPYQYAAEGATVPPGGVHWTWVVGEDWTPVTPNPAADDMVGGPEHYGCSVNLASVEEWPSQGSDHGWPVHMMRRVVANQMIEVDSSAAGHIVRHDPARVLREVEAKRRLLALHDIRTEISEIEGRTTMARWCQTCNEPDWCSTVLLLALPYADHPDYQAEWAPGTP